jgi:hypothetical protein
LTAVRRAPAARSRSIAAAGEVSAAFRHYADRGVFRGFHAAPAPRGRLQFTFTWLLGRPMTAVFDPSSATLTFRTLFPALPARSPAAGSIRDEIASRTSRTVPAHKRLDPRRAELAWKVDRSGGSLMITVRGRHGEYAVRYALNLVNDLFLVLHEKYPDYLIEQFGLREE